MSDDVTVVIVTYRSASMIAGCITSLADAAPRRALRAIVVDNASDDDTVAEVRRAAASAPVSVEVVERASNDGYAVGCNAGLARAAGAWVLFLNPDTVCPAGSIDALVDAAAGVVGAGLVAPALVGADGELQATVERTYRLGRVLLGLVRLGGANRPALPPVSGPPIEVPWVHTAVALLPTAVARAVGGFDPDYFMYMEDMDLCTRVRRSGHRVVVAPDVRFRHVGGASAALSGGAPVVARRRVASLARYLAVHQGRWAALVFGAATALSAALVTLAQTVARRPTAVQRAKLAAGSRVVGRLGRPERTSAGMHPELA